MTHHDLMVEAFLKRQEAAKRVLVAIKRSRKRGTLPSALQIADAPLAVSEEHPFYIFRTDTNAVLARGIQGFEAAVRQFLPWFETELSDLRLFIAIWVDSHLFV